MSPVRFVISIVAFGATMLAAAQPQAMIAKPGSLERKAILDGLRIPVEKELKTKVVFKVDIIKYIGGWAYFVGKPLQSNGKPIDYSKTKYAAAARAGTFEDGVAALLRKKGKKWTVLALEFGTYDPVEHWRTQYPKVPWGSFGG
jgi:hypothetical protein